MISPTAAQAYGQVRAEGSVADANAHRLIQMLLEGAIEKIVVAKGCMIRKDIKGKGQNLSASISIIDGLQASLDLTKGGEIAGNLYALYDYMMQRLIQANLDDSTTILDEVGRLLGTIKNGWDGIETEANQILAGKNPVETK